MASRFLIYHLSVVSTSSDKQSFTVDIKCGLLNLVKLRLVYSTRVTATDSVKEWSSEIAEILCLGIGFTDLNTEDKIVFILIIVSSLYILSEITNFFPTKRKIMNLSHSAEGSTLMKVYMFSTISPVKSVMWHCYIMQVISAMLLWGQRSFDVSRCKSEKSTTIIMNKFEILFIESQSHLA